MASLDADQALLDSVDAVVRAGDFATLTMKTVLKSLAAEFGEEHVGRLKKELRARTKEVMEQRAAELEEEDDMVKSESEEDVAKKSKRPRRETAMSLPTRKRAATTSAAVSGFAKPVDLSPQLAAFCADQPQLARTEVTRFITAYVKANDLQNEKDRRLIDCDAKLEALLGVSSCSFFSLQKHLAQHFPPKQPTKIKTAGSGKIGGFNKPVVLSAPLRALLETDENISRPQVVKRIWDHIRKHNLQKESNKCIICCDEPMRAVFKVDEVHMFKMNKTLSKHLSPAEDGDADESSTLQEQKPKVKVQPRAGPVDDMHDAVVSPKFVKQESDVKAESSGVDAQTRQIKEESIGTVG